MWGKLPLISLGVNLQHLESYRKVIECIQRDFRYVASSIFLLFAQEVKDTCIQNLGNGYKIKQINAYSNCL